MDNDIIPINQLPSDDVVPVSNLPSDNKQPDSLGSNLLAMGLGGAAAVGGGYGVTKAYQALEPARNKLAGDLVNSIIKPRHKEYMFGKNPGQAIAQEGISGMNLDSIGQKVDQRLNELNTYVKGIRELDANKMKKVNMENAFDPFYKALDELGKAPETHKAKINEIYGMVKDLEGNIPKDFSTKELPVETAYNIKGIIQKMQKWNVDNAGDDVLNKALRQVYHNVDASIDTVIPELASVNSRISNLISAKTAIANRAEVLSRQDPASLTKLLNIIPHAISNTATKSGVAKIIAEKFAGIGKLGEKSMPMLMTMPMILDAIKFAKDPQAYTTSQETGKSMEELQKMKERYQSGKMSDEEKISSGLAI